MWLSCNEVTQCKQSKSKYYIGKLVTKYLIQFQINFHNAFLFQPTDVVQKSDFYTGAVRSFNAIIERIICGYFSR